MFLQKMFDTQLLDNFLVDISFLNFFPYNLFFKFLFIDLFLQTFVGKYALNYFGRQGLLIDIFVEISLDFLVEMSISFVFW